MQSADTTTERPRILGHQISEIVGERPTNWAFWIDPEQSVSTRVRNGGPVVNTVPAPAGFGESIAAEIVYT